MLQYSTLHPSTEGDDLALAAVNLLALSFHGIRMTPVDKLSEATAAAADMVTRHNAGALSAEGCSIHELLQVKAQTLNQHPGTPCRGTLWSGKGC